MNEDFIHSFARKEHITREIVPEERDLKTPSPPETIGRYLAQSVSSQSVTENSEAGEEPIKTDWMR